MQNLLATKLNRPPLRPKRVRRPQLTQRLNTGLELGCQITLISAPAGFGKTVCACEWLEDLDDWAISWLSLDTTDDDPGRFFTYFVAALQKINATIGAEIEGVLQAGQLPPDEIISTTLINDILAIRQPFLLVLDDFHVIQDAFILQVLEQFISNLPEVIYLVLLTREDPSLPLARLRANNQLTEIRAADLRFKYSEIELFLKKSVGFSLSPFRRLGGYANLHATEKRITRLLSRFRFGRLSDVLPGCPPLSEWRPDRDAKRGNGRGTKSVVSLDDKLARGSQAPLASAASDSTASSGST